MKQMELNHRFTALAKGTSLWHSGWSKMLLAFVLIAMCPSLGLMAQDDDPKPVAIRYIYMNDGQVIAIPEMFIQSESQENGVVTLQLLGSEGFSYCVSNVQQITDSYTLTPAEVTSFGFTHADNDQVFKDVDATITTVGDTTYITADVPVLGKRLRPSFTLSDGATLWLDDVQQVSGQSSLRFEEPVVYTLARPKHWIYRVTEDVEEMPEGEWNLTPVTLTADILSTNAPSNYEEGLDKIIDGDNYTFFHSTWGDGTYERLPWVEDGTYGDGQTEWPYIDIALSEPVDNFCFSYLTSNQENRFPQGLLIKALNATTGNWDVIATIDEGLPQAQLTEYKSAVYALGKDYRTLRIELTRAAHKNYLVLAELNLFSAEENDVQETDPEYTGDFVPFGHPCKATVNYLTDEPEAEYGIPIVYLTFGDGTSWDKDNWIGQTVTVNGVTYNTKENWINDCTFALDGAGIWPDIETVEGCQIRGRGNSSWTWDYRSKNPYRVKFPKSSKQSPFNLTKDRQWVFIANKQKGSMITNAIAQKIAAMVDCEAPCYMVPIELYVNGHYRGSYTFTSKIGISKNSVNIDETIGCLLEMDDYYDEDYKFRDTQFYLPVNVKDPDFSEEDPDRVVTFDAIKTSFENMVAAVANKGDLSSYIDLETWARFWLVNDLVRNQETYHPKSCYIFNENPTDGEPWKFGPAWDFDWGFGYEGTRNYFVSGANTDLFDGVMDKAGLLFFVALRNCEQAKRAYYKEWVNFMAEGRLEELLEYIDDYTAFVSNSLYHNNEAEILETDNTDYEAQATMSKEWIRTRANYIFNSIEKYDISPDIIEPEDYGQPTVISSVANAANSNVDVYTLSGVCVRRQVPTISSLNDLTPGIYVVNGKVVAIP